MADREKFTGVILPRFWSELADLPLEVRALGAFLVTGGHNDAVPGLAKIAMVTIADELRISESELARLWRQLPVGFVEVDPRTRVVRVPNQPRLGHAPNHRVIRAWWRGWLKLPDCPMRTAHVLSLYASIKSDAGAETLKAWAETFGTIDTSTVSATVPTTVEATVHVPSLVPGRCDLPSSKLQTTTQTSEASNPRARKVGAQQVLIAGEVGEVAKDPSGWKAMLADWGDRYWTRTGQKLVWKALARHFPKARDGLAELGAVEVARRIEIRFTAAPAWMDRDGTPPDFGLFWDRINDFAVPARAQRPPARASPDAAADMAEFANELKAQGR